MTALSLAGLLASLAPAAIAAWRNPARDPESYFACLGTLALAWVLTFATLVRFPVKVQARPRALLVHIVWGIVAVLTVIGAISISPAHRAVLLLLPAAVHAVRLLRKPHALDLVLALQVVTLFAVFWVTDEPVEPTPTSSEIAAAERAIAAIPPDAPFSAYLMRIAAEDHTQLRDAMVSFTVSRVPGVEDKLIAALQRPDSISAAMKFLESEKAPCSERLAQATAALGVNRRACPFAP